MAVTQVQICNMALTHIGIKQLISAISEDNEEANMLDLFWDTALANALYEGDWGFARRRADLVLHAGTAPDPWQYQYVMPADAVRVLRIDDKRATRLPDDRIPFTRETDDSGNNLIYTDMVDAAVIYTYLETDTSEFSPPFVLYLSYVLASLIAAPLTGDDDLQERMEKRAAYELEKSLAKDLRGEQEHPEEEASWMQAREGATGLIRGIPADDYWD